MSIKEFKEQLKIARDNETILDKIEIFFSRLFSDIKGLKNSLRFAYQRARYGIDDSMTWDMDSYLTNHIIKLLEQYLKTADIYVDLTYNKHPDGRTLKQWVKDTIKAFETYEKLNEDMNPLRNPEDFKKVKEEMKDLFGDLFGGLWW